jgi:hypothetical protein
MRTGVEGRGGRGQPLPQRRHSGPELKRFFTGGPGCEVTGAGAACCVHTIHRLLETPGYLDAAAGHAHLGITNGAPSLSGAWPDGCSVATPDRPIKGQRCFACCVGC